MDQPMREAIAIIGMASRFPNASDNRQFWDIIAGGIDCVTDCPAGRKKDIDIYLDNIGQAQDGRVYRKAAYLREIDKFDYEFFRIPPKEASLMDPHQRLFLETAYHALEDAGYAGSLGGTRTGIYVGFPTEFSAKMYQHIIFETKPELAGDSFTGNLPAILPARLSYHLNLRGPSLLVDTSCSSSLVAIHLASQSILQGECEYALAGGVNLFVVPIVNEAVEGIGIVSSDGKTKSFDDHCDGVGQGEGVGAVLLKPLSKAMEDGDNIYAVVRSTAVNQDGKSIGITAPSASAQEEALVEAWERAAIDPETVTYLEAHGTATKLGDPTELQGIKRAFRRYTDKAQFCAIGSVKSNIGHTIGAAGAAGVIKSALALAKKQIPPNVHFKLPNRSISFEESPVYISNQLKDWDQPYPRRSGVSSFGISGTNCHVVLEEAPPRDRQPAAEQQVHMFTLSAPDMDRLKEMASVYRDFLSEGYARELDIHDICFTVNTGRTRFACRLAIIVTGADDLLGKLNRLLKEEWNEQASGPDIWTGRAARSGGAGPEETSAQQRPLPISEFEDEAAACLAYISGQEINWEDTYSGCRKASLPGYPFKRHRCWIQGSPSRRNNATDAPAEERFYRTVWEERPLAMTGKEGAGKTIAVFTDGTMIGSSVVEGLREAGNRVIEIVPGRTYEQMSEHQYRMPGDAGGYSQLVAAIKHMTVHSFVLLSALSGARSVRTIEDLRQELQYGVYALFYLTKALHSHAVQTPAKLLLAARNANEVTGGEEARAEHNAMFGFAKAVQWEFPHLKCKCIDIGDGTSVRQLIDEIGSGNYEHFVTAYRNGKRYIEVVAPADVDRMEERKAGIKEGGTYIITGGTGRIGLRLASYIAAFKDTRLILLNRSGFPDRADWERLLAEGADDKLCGKIRMALEVEKRGATLRIIQCDVSDEAEARETFDAIRREFGGINGIVHCAVSDENVRIADMTSGHLQASFSSKIEASWIINRMTENESIDFIVLCSSVMTLVSGHANAIYTAGNCYLDAFPLQTKREGMLTINWPEWKDIGLDESKTVSEDQSLFRKIAEREAIDIFEALLAKPVPRMIVGKLNYESAVFELLDYLPFNVSDAIRMKLPGRAGASRRARAAAKGAAEAAGAAGKASAASAASATGAAGTADATDATGTADTAGAGACRAVNHAGPSAESAPSAEELPLRLKGRDSGVYTETERRLAAGWISVLGYEEIDITDNFFELGGSSIAAVRISIELTGCGIVLEAPDILRYQTIEKIAKFLDEGGDPDSGEQARPAIYAGSA